MRKTKLSEKKDNKNFTPGIYKHYKGKNYEALGIAHHSETLQELVVYKALYDNPEYGKNALWVRPREMFLEKVSQNGRSIPRFRFLTSIKPQPRIGVGVIVRHQGKVLVGKRRNAHGDGTWSVPGGNLDFGESVESCAKREVFEETGIQITNIKQCSVTNDYFRKEEKHYITLWVVSDYKSGNPTIKEPDKYVSITWRTWDDLPKPQFLPLQHLLKTTFDPFMI